MMAVESIGDVLLRAQTGCGRRTSGEIAIVFSPDEVDRAAVADKILVLTKCDDSYLSLLKNARGVILQNLPEDVESERYVILVGRALSLSAVVRAERAHSSLQNGQVVTIDPIEGLVFNGHVEPWEEEAL